MVVFLHMGWRDALFANWPIAPELVRPTIPDGLTLDTYDGAAWLSVVPFTNVDVRPQAMPAGTGLPLPELNLRTYVRYDDTPSIYFYSLDAQGLMAVLGARLTHHLPYYYARIDHDTDGDRITFRSRRLHPGDRPVRFTASYEPTGNEFYAEPGTLHRFLTARHRLYTEAPSGELRYTEAYHAAWPLTDVEVEIDAASLLRANGFDVPDADPICFYSPGVETVAAPSMPADRAT